MKAIFIRLDDACHAMDWPLWRALEKLLDEFCIKPIVAVVPDCKDEKICYGEYNDAFWDWVRAVQAKGWIIGMHGFQHSYVTSESGLIPINHQSEFAGLDYAEQKRKIEASLAIFNKQGVEPDIWVAPSHSFDQTTLAVLRDVTNIRTISDGIAFYPYDEDGFLWIPQQHWRFKKASVGVVTICLHPSWMTLENIAALRPALETFKTELQVDIEQMRSLYGTRKKSCLDRLYWHYFFMKKRLGDFLYPAK